MNIIPFKANSLKEVCEPVWVCLENEVGEWGHWPSCPSCGTLLEDINVACPHCGQMFIRLFPEV